MKTSSINHEVDVNYKKEVSDTDGGLGYAHVLHNMFSKTCVFEAFIRAKLGILTVKTIFLKYNNMKKINIKLFLSISIIKNKNIFTRLHKNIFIEKFYLKIVNSDTASFL